MSNDITIHAVFNAHLDPVWMWPWTAGLDEAIGTARSACDQLDRHPGLFYTQGEAWTLSMVERADPALFERIRGHVAAGRWEVVNGWWTQPDCNFPTEAGLRHQISSGLKWVGDRFGVRPRCGFNPDSFGHCARLPELLREAGQDRYVFMRPQPHEMALPARLFRWRSRPEGPAVTAFRIADSYMNGMGADIWQGPVANSIRDLPAGCRHTMAFFGVGDHGGGPTDRLVRWVEQNRDIVPGATLVFSTVGRFFEAIEGEAVTLPEVVGELQRHAIGCYSVVRATKQALRRAEHALARAESVAAPVERERIASGWEAVSAHAFHDTIGGSSTPEAYRFVEDQLGGAAAAAEEITAYAVRRQMRALPDDEHPRLVFANPAADPFEGWVEGTVYVEGVWRQPWRLLDASGQPVAHQVVSCRAGVAPNWLWGLRRVLLRAGIPAGGLYAVRLDLGAPPARLPPRVSAEDGALCNMAGVSVDIRGPRPQVRLRDRRAWEVALHLLPDPSDTWSHGLDRYAEEPATEAAWDEPRLVEQGPLMASIAQEGSIGGSRLTAEWRVYADEPWVELGLEVLWCERDRILKLVVPCGAGDRTDGTPGMAVVRPGDGREYPLHDWTLCDGLGVVAPDVYAMDAAPGRARLTLLRSPLMARHDPQGAFPGAVVADQGRHFFRFRFWLEGASPAVLAAEALRFHRPPLAAELTRGMTARWTEYAADGRMRE